MSDLRLFVDYFRREIEVVKALRLPEESRQASLDLAFHRKILCLAMLESLAAIRFGKSGNQRRFKSLIELHGGWAEAAWVSVPVLHTRIGRGNDTPLIRELRRRLRQHSSADGGSFALKDFDSPVPKLLPLAESDEEKEELGKCTHLDLLWSFRNFVVHEYREPGYSMEAFGDEASSPCYHGYSGDPSWHLLYPVGFFVALLERTIANLEDYFETSGENPYLRVYDTTLWQQA